MTNFYFHQKWHTLNKIAFKKQIVNLGHPSLPKMTSLKCNRFI